MEKIARIFENEIFAETIRRVEEAEKDRVFCRHGISHLIDVARVAWIMCLENGLPLEKEMVYATALFHDIGRMEEYETGTPHDQASCDMARRILPECGFSAEEIERVCAAIMTHKNKSFERESSDDLAEVIRFADKASRLCFICDVRDECYWPEQVKTKHLDR